MKRASDDMPTPSPRRRGRRSVGFAAMAVIGCGALLLGACGGDDDDAEGDSSTTTTSASGSESGATTTVAAATTTTAPATTTSQAPLDLVTEGATVVVANASGINGAAGRMTDALDEVGFTTGEPTNSTEGPLETTKIYYDPANENAQPVADSLRQALGGGDIEVLEMPDPPPTESGDIGDATVLVAVGNDTADKPLDELQGRAAPAEDTGDEESSSEPSGDDTTTDQSDEESSSEPSGDDTTTDQSDEQSSDG